MDALMTRLCRLECHFTWDLREEDFSLEDLVNRLEEQIKLESEQGEARVTRPYSSLAFVSYLYGDLNAALTNLYKSEELAKQYYGEDSDKFLMVTYGDLAWLYYHINNFSLAEDYLRQVDRISAKFSEGSDNKIHSEVLREKAWALLKFSRKYYSGAGECFRQALEISPDDSDLNAGYAIALYRTTTDPPGSQDSMTAVQLRRAIDLNPTDAVLLVLLALRLIYLKKSPKSKIHDPFLLKDQCGESIDLVVKALEMSPENPHVMRYVAQFSRRLGSVDFALCQLEKTLVHTPDSAFIHHQLALCYKSQKIFFEKKYGPRLKVDNYEANNCLRKCIYHLEKAVSLKPTFTVALADLAVHYGQIQNIAKAETLFQQAFENNDSKDHLQAVHSLYGEFQLYSKGSEQSAVYHYMEGLRLDVDTLEGKKCEADLNRIASFRFKRDPDDSKAHAIQGFIHELKGEQFEAVECYKKALIKGIGIGESPLLTELRIWLLGFKGTETSARDVILGGHTYDVAELGSGRPAIIKGKMALKTVRMIETDLRSAKKILLREKSVLTPGPHVIVLAFHHDGELTEETKGILEDLEVFGESVWKHVIVMFTNEDTSLSGQNSVLQWLLEKCELRYYIIGTGTQITQTIELSERVKKMISGNNTMHLVIPPISSKQSPLKMEPERDKGVLFTPVIAMDKGLSKYRLRCKHAGWFYCELTQLGFRMNGEGEVLYTTVDKDSRYPVSTNHYAAGPLYDIKCVQGELSQLQLPHCEISPDEDCNLMTVAHYTDHSVDVLKPENITHTHVTVSVPGTSYFRLQKIINWFKGKIRGQVILMYHRPPQHRLHVFVVPRNVDPRKVDECEDEGVRFLAPGNCNNFLEHGSKYIISCDIRKANGHSLTGMIQPKDAVFLREKHSYYHPTFVINLQDEEAKKVRLCLRQQITNKEVWYYELDLKDSQIAKTRSPAAGSQRKRILQDEETCMAFIKNKYADLVQKVTNVDAIVDGLVNLIHGEIRTFIETRDTPQNKMRALLNLVGKDMSAKEFLQHLHHVHPNLVEELLE